MPPHRYRSTDSKGAEQNQNVVIVPVKIAEELGSVRSQNICLLGALIAALNLEGVDWEKLVASSVPPKTIDVNVAAFKAGYKAVKPN